MKKIVNIEKAPGKIVPTLVNSKDHPEHFVEEVAAVVKEEAKEEAPAPKKKVVSKKKVDKK